MSTLSRDYEYGRIVSVDVITLGDNLAADAAMSDTTITVEDAADFDEDGGSLLLNDVVYTYVACDDDTGIISGLDPVLAAAAVEGDDVSVYDPLYAIVATDKVAQVAVIGDDGAVDMLECAIALHLADKLEEGVRGGKGESVKIELDGGEWLVVDIRGLSDPATGPGGGDKFKIDPFVVAAPGAQALALTHVPLPESHHLYWNGEEQEGAYTIDGQIAVIDSTEGATLEVGDELVVKYAYKIGPVIPDVTPDDVPLECSTMTVQKPTAGEPYTVYDGRYHWTRDMTFSQTWKAAGSYPLKAVGYYVFKKTGDLSGYPYRTKFEGPWDSSAHGIAPAGLDYGLGTNGGVSFFNPGAGGAAAGVETTVVVNPTLSFEDFTAAPPLDMDLIGFGYFVPAGEHSYNLPQVHGDGLIGLTDPSQCMWYWGTKIAETDDDRDEPIGGV